MSTVPKLYYWGMPGRAEYIRLAFHAGGVEFENIAVTGPSYGELKASLSATVPQINLPMLEVNGQHFVESKAILRYAGAMGGLIPSDPLQQLKMDEAICMTEDVFGAVFATFSIKDEAEKLAARKALSGPEGKLTAVLKKFDAYLSGCTTAFICGDELSIADIAVFCVMGNMVAGFLDGLDLDMLKDYAGIQAMRKKVATHAKVASRYENETEGPLFNGFK
eukprot:CAMPEP_0181288148 /NCGR_PEP_ID=MMETSP1101-20121128/173_1 /TAXON_ID=46948 /ORGANISM="Rhodomonas abbreviata, Strain Caron Lab Isolate" /LENGTH=220 /DNA_ID=CAMNT_0023392241 /DNA_START=38 /DNA_END=697 /DNA_ORIENTATION=-